MMRGGSLVDATLIQAPSSTKNAPKQRDPEMHSTQKSKPYYFGTNLNTTVQAKKPKNH
jgi:IS5 family transposase